MPDIIQLLPDSIANQIAAGEVIQRPASVVKELMENAIDAGSTEINVIIKDAGKTLIQVIDNGSGMSETDARLSFERHATSKIRQASDLFSIRTKGFRGEALASIAAIAQIEMITKLHDQDLGSRLILEGSQVKKQEFCQASNGSKISVKNLFYNVPARRKFLKTDSVELKHLTDEFMRIALSHENVKFTLHHNDREMYHLSRGRLIQRISGLFGKKFTSNLLPFSEETDIVRLEGYIGKAEIAKRSRNQQFLFVNKRYIKSNYLNHAVKLAYDNIIQPDQYPVFFVFLEIDPERIDINIHPTKQEIKFEEERLIYNFLRVAVKQALGKYSVTPLLDFEKNQGVDQLFNKAGNIENRDSFGNSFRRERNENAGDWQDLFEGLNQGTEGKQDPLTKTEQSMIDFADILDQENYKGQDSTLSSSSTGKVIQIHGSYIISQIKTGFIIIDQRHAHERILYEKQMKLLENQEAISQREMFPVSIEMSPEKSNMLNELIPELIKFGFEIEHFGQNTFIVKATPSSMEESVEMQNYVDGLIDSYSSNIELKLGINENLARSFAVSSAVRRKKSLSPEEMQLLIDELFACENPYTSPRGKKCFVTYNLADLSRLFSS